LRSASVAAGRGGDQRAGGSLGVAQSLPQGGQALLGLGQGGRDVTRAEVRMVSGGHCCIEPKGLLARAQSSKAGSAIPVENYDKTGIRALWGSISRTPV
jgi:hypothetical protein